MPGTPNSSTIDLSISTSQGFAVGIGRYSTTLFINLATLTDAAQANFILGHKGRLLTTAFVVHQPATTALKLSTLTPSIDGVNVTGGVIALTSANCTPRNNRVSGTAITGLNSFSATSVLTVTGSGTTAFVEGTGWLLVTLVNDDLVEALAKALFGARTP